VPKRKKSESSDSAQHKTSTAPVTDGCLENQTDSCVPMDACCTPACGAGRIARPRAEIVVLRPEVLRRCRDGEGLSRLYRLRTDRTHQRLPWRGFGAAAAVSQTHGNMLRSIYRNSLRFGSLEHDGVVASVARHRVAALLLSQRSLWRAFR
jgi:hypothetical protein